jgi:hypothetical protein
MANKLTPENGGRKRDKKERKMKILSLIQASLGAALLSLTLSTSAAPAPAAPGDADTYDQREIVTKANELFGATTEGLARAVERVFAEKGRPNAYITGQEGGGAVVVGLRYGSGDLYMKKNGSKSEKVYWQGPSVGFDFGGNASKVFTLIYNLPNSEAVYQRFPGVEGSAYIVAGVGVNYQQSGRIILAPMRTGVGLRAGANIGYLSYSKERSVLPF